MVSRRRFLGAALGGAAVLAGGLTLATQGQLATLGGGGAGGMAGGGMAGGGMAGGGMAGGGMAGGGMAGAHGGMAGMGGMPGATPAAGAPRGTVGPAGAMGGMPGMGGATGAGAMGGMAGMGGATGDVTTPNVASALPVPRFQVPLPRPPVLRPIRADATTDYYALTLRQAQVEIVPGKKTTVWGFDGLFPGPTIRARRGRRAVVRQTNSLAVPTSIHLHGGHVAPEMDGHPTDLVQPGASKEYEYPNQQPGATLWYHEHAMDGTARGVAMGLAGFYVVVDDAEAALGLPDGEYDVPLVIQDRAFAADGSFQYPGPDSMPLLMNGMLGDTILVNGAPHPRLEVAARKYRFRILNGSNARHYMLALSNGQPLTVIAGDGGLLPAPVPLAELSVTPAERYEVVVDFSRAPVGAQVVLQNRMGEGGLAEVMRFDVVRAAADPSTVPAVLRPVERLDPATAAQTREWTLNMQMGPGMMGGAPWVINGQPFDARRLDAQPKLGTTEVWRFTNPSPMMHPMHVHDVMFQLLDRDGQPPPPEEMGWKDTVHVPAGSSVRVIARFVDYTGTYVFHCHILEHEDRAMMSQFRVV